MGLVEPFAAPPAMIDIQQGLRALLADGLPVEEEKAGEILLRLRGVWARSAHPDDPSNRVYALNKLLRQEINSLPQFRERDWPLGARIIFGIEPGYKNLNLSKRREVAARELGYNDDHFRKEVVDQILLQLARQLRDDHNKYFRTRDTVPPRQEAYDDTAELTDEHVSSRERAQQEELVSRIWECVYGMRAEHLAISRLKRWPDNEHSFEKLEEARGSLLWYTTRVIQAVRQYIDDYGDRIMMGGASYNVEALIRLGGWRSEIPPGLEQKLRLILAQSQSKEAFVDALRSEGIWLGTVTA